MVCNVCSENEAIIDKVYGVLPCEGCKARRGSLKSPDHLIEFTSDEIKTGRKEYKRDIYQPYRGTEPSKEFIESYPEVSKEMFTDKERAKAVNVWDD